MSNIENEFIRRFSNSQTSNDGLDSDALWGSITEELDEGKPATGTSTWNKLYWLISSIFFLAIVIFSGQFMFNDEDQNIISDANKTLEAIIDLKPNNQSRNNLAKTDNTKTNKDETTNSTNENDEVPMSSSSNVETIYKIEPVAEFKNTISPEVNAPLKKEEKNTESRVAVPELNNGSTKQNDSSKPVTIIKSSDNENELPNPPSSEEKLKSRFDRDDTANEILANNDKMVLADNLGVDEALLSLSIDQVELLDLRLGYSRIIPFLAVAPSDAPLAKPVKPKSRLSLELIGGVNSLNMKYANAMDPDFAQLKNETTKPYWGQTIGVNINKSFVKGFVLNGGVAYHNLWSTFDYENSTDTVAVVQDALIKVWINSATGDTLNELRIDTTVNAKLIHNIVHYNQFRKFSIPITFGYQVSKGKFDYGFTAGPVLHLTFDQKGRSFDSGGEVNFFTKESEAVPFNKFELGFIVRPYFQYNISPKLGLTFQPQWTYSRSKSYARDIFKIGKRQLNFNAGISYKL